MNIEQNFRDMTDDIDQMLADPAVRQAVEQHLEQMREADRAHAMGLAALRRAADLTQQDLAATLGVTQGAVARAEKRPDMLLSTLNAYVNAIGGHLDIVVTFDNGQRVSINLSALKAGDDVPPSAAAA